MKFIEIGGNRLLFAKIFPSAVVNKEIDYVIDDVFDMVNDRLIIGVNDKADDSLLNRVRY